MAIYLDNNKKNTVKIIKDGNQPEVNFEYGKTNKSYKILQIRDITLAATS